MITVPYEVSCYQPAFMVRGLAPQTLPELPGVTVVPSPVTTSIERYVKNASGYSFVTVPRQLLCHFIEPLSNAALPHTRLCAR